MSEPPSIVELMERLALLEASLAGANGRVEALTAENRKLAEEGSSQLAGH